jgi:hypothetical protein
LLTRRVWNYGALDRLGGRKIEKNSPLFLRF